MSAAVLSTGTELMRGELVNTNASWLAEALTALGFDVVEQATVGDDAGEIRAALERLGARHAVVVCTGGLGPTTDDLTNAVVADLLGVPLERDAASLALIEERLSRFGRKLAASNAKQADFPRGATILANDWGTAPGFAVRIGQALTCFMPGVPSEMRAMFHARVAPLLAPLERAVREQIKLRTFGLAESEINDRLAGVEAAFDVLLGYRASLPEIEVKVLAGGANAEEARTRARAAADEARRRIGPQYVYAEGDVSYPAALVALLAERGATLALAESCTGGLAAELITLVPGASRVFVGGVVSYSNELKVNLLGVPAELIAAHGAVSAEVARAMAEGARHRLGATHAVAFTGIAGPDGGSVEKPVGLVHFALAAAGKTDAAQRVFPGTREQVRKRAVYSGLTLLRRALLE
ncbi:MAG TPA: competence/damage-inducible protein A [Polyangiaceae bacterium]|jgi:nicotinamide-nucleotide amidase|nr:competence/damage-inducible protein A [Polyangiaceae bacterium]